MPLIIRGRGTGERLIQPPPYLLASNLTQRQELEADMNELDDDELRRIQNEYIEIIKDFEDVGGPSGHTLGDVAFALNNWRTWVTGFLSRRRPIREQRYGNAIAQMWNTLVGYANQLPRGQ